MHNYPMLGDAPLSTVLPTTDLKRAREFYEVKLGLKVTEASDSGILLEAGRGTSLYLYERGPAKSEHTLASFEVTDLDSKVDEMSKSGITFEQYDFPGLKTNEKGIATLDEDGEKSAWFKDPDGNILAVSQKI